MLLDLFLTFLMIGAVSFGGGYAMLGIMQDEVVTRHGWMTAQEFTDVIAVAGMSPGSIATNSAIFIGYSKAHLLGAVTAALGMMLPSLIIILAVGTIFYKIQHHRMVKSAFYGLRAIITGLIIYAAALFAVNNKLIASISWHTVSQIAIFAGSLAALMYFRIHPVYVIILSGLVGIAIYS